MEASMQNYSISLPSWTIGEQALDSIGRICRPYGIKTVVIGGHLSTAAIQQKLEAATAKAHIAILDFLYYGGEASEENIERLSGHLSVLDADMIFAVGGGKALDTGKALGARMHKPVFTFPTIASTCAATTAVSILYHPDGSFAGPCFLGAPAIHTFIDTEIIASAPPRYLWAGLGDTYAKYFESVMSSRNDELNHYHALGVNTSRNCLEPLLQYGQAAMEDHKAKRVTPELEQVILSIIVTTGIASILLTADRIIDYNTGLAHAIFYALTTFPEFEIEKDHLHGEVVGFGVLILLLVDHNMEMFETLFRFNRSVSLPVSPEDIGISWSDIPRILPTVVKMHDIDHNPYPITESMLDDAFDRLEKYTLPQ